MAHASAEILMRVLKAAGNEYKEDEIRQVAQNCPCVERHRKLQRPLVSSYLPKYPGHRVGMDVFYIENQSAGAKPYLAI